MALSERSPTAKSKKWAALASVSSGLTRKPRCVPGTQVVAADQAVVPPTSAVRSTNSTFAPSTAAFKAAEKPAAPEPSNSTSTLSLS
jgi:hypothetical protein